MDLCSSQLPLVDNEVMNLSDFGYDNEGSSSGYDSETEHSSSDKEQDTTISNNSSSTDEPEVMKYGSTQELCNTLQYIISLPDLCDVMFFVGERRVPVYGMKAVLATRSRVFYSLILEAQRQSPLSKKTKKKSKQNPALSKHIVIKINKYKPEDFQQLVTFVHCGKVNITALLWSH